MHPDPIRCFVFSIGGYPGPHFFLQLKEQCLFVQQSLDYDPTPALFTFSVEENPHWLQLLDFLATRNWKGTYGDPMSLDGTSWELTVRWEKRKLAADGSNGYPAGFQKFLRLLNRVTAEKGLTIR